MKGDKRRETNKATDPERRTPAPSRTHEGRTPLKEIKNARDPYIKLFGETKNKLGDK